MNNPQLKKGYLGGIVVEPWWDNALERGFTDTTAQRKALTLVMHTTPPIASPLTEPEDASDEQNPVVWRQPTDNHSSAPTRQTNSDQAERVKVVHQVTEHQGRKGVARNE